MPSLTREKLLHIHKEMCQRSRVILAVKNQDYAQQHDPLKNFKAADFLEVDPGIGLLLRVMDKVSRLHSYWQSGELKAESVDDAEEDIMNYMVLHRGLRYERDESLQGDEQGGVCVSSGSEDSE